MNPAMTPSLTEIVLALLVQPLLLAVAGWLLARWLRLLTVPPQYILGVDVRLRWSGYLQANADEYMRIWSQEILERIGSLQQVFEQLSPEKISAHQLHYLRPQLDALIDEVMSTNNLVLWQNLPVLVKNRLYARAHRLLPRILDDTTEELGDGLSRIVSQRGVLEFAQQQDDRTLRRFHNIISRQAFRSITLWCMLLGFGGGIIQVIIAAIFDLNQATYWIMSAAMIGFSLYWLSRHLTLALYRQLDTGPDLGRMRLFYDRNQQNAELAEFLSEHLYSIRNIAGALLENRKSHHLQLVIKRRVSSIVEDLDIRTILQLSLGPAGYVKLKNKLSRRLTSAIISPLYDTHFNRQRAASLTKRLQPEVTRIPTRVMLEQINRVLSPLATAGGVSGIAAGLMAGAVQWLVIVLILW